jgi:hypothetical protein
MSVIMIVLEDIMMLVDLPVASHVDLRCYDPSLEVIVLSALNREPDSIFSPADDGDCTILLNSPELVMMLAWAIVNLSSD